MSQSPSRSQFTQLILKQLSHLVKLRMILVLAILAGWYILYFGPLSERMAATVSRTTRERRSGATAREIEQLKKALAPARMLMLTGADVHELMRHVIDRLRSSPLKLIDLKPEKPRDQSPYEAIGLQLKLEGCFTDIDKFLAWVETDHRLLRIDSNKLDPTSRDPGRLLDQITMLTLGEKAEVVTKTKVGGNKNR
jgi:Tfp pilus assembly protein PilO